MKIAIQVSFIISVHLFVATCVVLLVIFDGCRRSGKSFIIMHHNHRQRYATSLLENSQNLGGFAPASCCVGVHCSGLPCYAEYDG